MLLLVADAGSTKTDWRAVREDGSVTAFRTRGFNPSVGSSGGMLEDLLQAGIPAGEVGKVFFYGAGIVPGRAEAAAVGELGRIFPNAFCLAASDVLGAARALFGKEEGVAAILGTGSATALCRGGEIVRSIPGGGYVLGDEGAGTWIGRSLLADYLKGLMPEGLAGEFGRTYGTDYASAVEAVYRKEYPNRYLASFVPFAAQRQDDPYVAETVERGFRLFFKRNVLPYGNYRARFTGSVAGIFRKALLKAALECGVQADAIVPSPADALVRYHIAEGRETV